LRPPFERQLAIQIAAHRCLAPKRRVRGWFERVVLSEEAREVLAHLYASGIGLREIFTPLTQTAMYGRGTWRYMKPTTARRAAQTLRALRPVLEAIEAARPHNVSFKATSRTYTDEELWTGTYEDVDGWAACWSFDDGELWAGCLCWSVAPYVSEWLPRYLEACASQRTGVVAVGRPKDHVLRWCAATLDELVRTRTGTSDHHGIGVLLKAAFPKRFHRQAADGADHADAVRDLIRRRRRRRRTERKRDDGRPPA
jgi:hypothetical protein